MQEQWLKTKIRRSLAGKTILNFTFYFDLISFSRTKHCLQATSTFACVLYTAHILFLKKQKVIKNKIFEKYHTM